MTARAAAENPEQPLRLSCTRFWFLARALRQRGTSQVTVEPGSLHRRIVKIYSTTIIKLTASSRDIEFSPCCVQDLTYFPGVSDTVSDPRGAGNEFIELKYGIN